MKQTDFDRLKAVCEKKGFEILNLTHDDNEKYVLVKKQKDIWEGVEFVQSISPTSSCTTQWKIYKVKQITEKTIWIEIDDYLSTTTNFLKKKSKPSTESAYIEQLKAECFKRFGEIDKGDNFKLNEVINQVPNHCGSSVYFRYEKNEDSLFYKGVLIYQQGKWAARVKERVKVDDNFKSITNAFELAIDKYGSDKFNKFLASKLEEYLNKQ